MTTIKAPFFEIGPKSYLYGDDVLALERKVTRRDGMGRKGLRIGCEVGQRHVRQVECNVLIGNAFE